MKEFLRTLWSNQQGQNIAEYAVMLAVILVLVVGTIRLVGTAPTLRFLQRQAQFSKTFLPIWKGTGGGYDVVST